jgi:hypothetical protein
MLSRTTHTHAVATIPIHPGTLIFVVVAITIEREDQFLPEAQFSRDALPGLGVTGVKLASCRCGFGCRFARWYFNL